MSVKTLIIMDGFGYPTDCKRSGVREYNTTHLRALAKQYPATLLYASEKAVGLSKKQAGSSNVGHLAIGTGRVIYQAIEKINNSIKKGDFFENPALLKAMENAKLKDRALHIMGIATDGGVHSHINHLLALLKMCSQQKVKKVYLHLFTDGRDTPMHSSKKYFKKIEAKMKEYNVGEIATIIGRLYALDRDNNWDRVELAYNAMVNSVGVKETNIYTAIDNAYAKGETDEFIKPIVMHKNGKPIAKVKKNDSVILFNFRADRERQLARAFDDDNDLNFGSKDLSLTFVGMCEYDVRLKNMLVAFPTVEQNNILSQVLSERGYKQLKVAETEKYAYVTFAFNNGRIEPYENEDRILVNSPKMQSYAGKPEMSAYEVASKTEEAILSGKYDVIVINFANGDMVGHSGDMEATKIAVKVVDECVDKLINATKKVGGSALITADHGNSDIMLYEDGTPCTTHTTNLVPFILVDEKYKNCKLREGGTLIDIAPTLLDLLDEEKPVEMTGNTLIIH